MKIEHLEERIQDYENSIKTVVDKRMIWNEKVKGILKDTLSAIASRYTIGWKVQELSWIHNNEAINITFDSFPPKLIDCTNLIPAYQFISGGALLFSQTYSGDVAVVMLFPKVDQVPDDGGLLEFGVYTPDLITEKLIVEKVDEFLKEIIQWEVPPVRKRVGF